MTSAPRVGGVPAPGSQRSHGAGGGLLPAQHPHPPQGGLGGAVRDVERSQST